ncbi:MAG: peptide ABC transporter permease [Hydrogenophilales bacterium 16-64-46]|nr:MAG: peptide ABC transporter permease [Hydrogenophilales bacterium 12-64-13]OYZ04898.1 MAG: peptide ABC transporter permease [Hydrogenophilales bacterium 16-64-46]OZA37541.1 MAG: peptide ABC transporter permease [Hydrogenophilales bacterium 17-64-34]HQT00727.1 ABC transporter permease [Thiobacillus sp.]
MSAIQPVILWTDALVFALVAGVTGLVLYIRRHEHLRAPWAGVARQPMAMGSALVLAVFVVIGLLDSLHYRERLPDSPPDKPQYSVEVLSAFDALVGPLRTQQEKTYSAPLAMHLYAKEFVDHDGVVVREYPRLKYGGAHLESAAAHWADIVRRVLLGSVQGLAIALLLVGVLAAWQARRSRQSYGEWLTVFGTGRLGWPGRTLATMLALIAIAIAVLLHLAAGYHVLGTDKVGQDVLYISLKSIRTGLVIGTLTTLVTLPLAVVLGIAAGYFRGWVDDVIQYVYTVLNSIPGVLLIAAAVLIVQVYIESNPELFDTAAARADIRLLALCLIMGMTSWTGLARLLRGESLKLSTLDYVEAARAFGVSHSRILGRHIFPNVFHLVLIAIVLDFSGLVLAEAVLSYVGVGVDPSMYSWGNMINGARLELAREPVVWWQLGAAFAFMFTLVLAANLFADGVRDAFDPRLGGRR